MIVPAGSTTITRSDEFDASAIERSSALRTSRMVRDRTRSSCTQTYTPPIESTVRTRMAIVARS